MVSIDHRGSEHHGIHPTELERAMSKNKGGREVRKPKQPKKPKIPNTDKGNPRILEGTVKNPK